MHNIECVILEKKVSCEPLIQTEIDSSVTPNSALFSWWFLRNWFISPLVHKTKTPLVSSIIVPQQLLTSINNKWYEWYQLISQLTSINNNKCNMTWMLYLQTTQQPIVQAQKILSYQEKLLGRVGLSLLRSFPLQIIHLLVL